MAAPAVNDQKNDNNNTCSYTIDIVKLFGYPGTDDNYSYFIIDNNSGQTMVVDPAVHEPPIMKRWKELQQIHNNKLSMVGVLTTHKHKDHSKGNGAMKKKFPNIKVYGGKNDNIKQYLGDDCFTDEVVEGDCITFGKSKIKVYDVPCHTRGHVLYYLTDLNDKFPSLFTGDTLFVGGVGFFFEGTGAEMANNFNKIANFPNDTKLYIGHEYAASNYSFGIFVEPNNDKLKKRFKWAKQQKQNNGLCTPSTVQIEKDTNVFMRCSNSITKEGLIAKWTQALTKPDLNLNKNQTFNTQGDVMQALRDLKSSKMHIKYAKI